LKWGKNNFHKLQVDELYDPNGEMDPALLRPLFTDLEYPKTFTLHQATPMPCLN
jgi:hypothetical protein